MNERSFEISAERQEYAKSRDRVRELFDELEQLAKAA